MKRLGILAVSLSCLLSGAALAGNDHSKDAEDRQVRDPADQSILDHERRDEQRQPGVGSGAGTDGTDSRTEGSGTTSESVPNNIPPARQY